MKLKSALISSIVVISCFGSLPARADIETEALVYKTAALLDQCLEQIDEKTDPSLKEQKEATCAKKFLRIEGVKKNKYASWDYLVLSTYYIDKAEDCQTEARLSASGINRDSYGGSIQTMINNAAQQICDINNKTKVLDLANYVNSPSFDLLNSKLP